MQRHGHGVFAVLALIIPSSKSTPLSSNGCACTSGCDKSWLASDDRSKFEWCYVDATCKKTGWDWCHDTQVLYKKAVDQKKEAEHQRLMEAAKRSDAEKSAAISRRQLVETQKKQEEAMMNAASLQHKLEDESAKRSASESDANKLKQQLVEAQVEDRKLKAQLVEAQSEAQNSTLAGAQRIAQAELEAKDAETKRNQSEVKLHSIEAKLHVAEAKRDDAEEKRKLAEAKEKDAEAKEAKQVKETDTLKKQLAKEEDGFTKKTKEFELERAHMQIKLRLSARKVGDSERKAAEAARRELDEKKNLAEAAMHQAALAKALGEADKELQDSVMKQAQTETQLQALRADSNETKLVLDHTKLDLENAKMYMKLDADEDRRKQSAAQQKKSRLATFGKDAAGSLRQQGAK